MSFHNTIYRIVDGVTIPGVFLQAFIKNGEQYFVTEIKVYKDGRIDCWGMVDFDGFKEKVSKGWITTHLSEGARVSMMVSGLNFTAYQVKSRVEEQEFVKEVEDEIRRLNGQLTTGEICRQRLTQYKHEPNETNKQYLRQAYDAVPKHCRIYLGDMDDKDWEYRSILNKWSD
ncbi:MULTISPECIES: hypothetical protein [unclassified Nostoc]|uniref:DUF7638 domain-containing protein n=1 Tax=unclassified Nostoc TaxID=2593658 RepID=UPI002AD49435|nr:MULTISPECIES: hypothetical protein [unclassified Nostoc]MDZ8031561.1 hypothetical protein [Nostoc sp. DedSLP04]MDZ8138370.1 hypothetical protein [Nostoc sp. DedQUE04]